MYIDLVTACITPSHWLQERDQRQKSQRSYEEELARLRQEIDDLRDRKMVSILHSVTQILCTSIRYFDVTPLHPNKFWINL